MSRPSAEFFRDMLTAATLDEREVAERTSKALDPAYWLELLGRDLAARPLVSGAADEERTAAAAADFAREGVYRVEAAIEPQTILTLNRILDAVTAAGWPGVFAFATDAFWECARLEPVRALVEAVLGAGAKQIPHVWTHIVKARGEQSGWSPHVDGPGERRMTVWIALSDAGLDNGCMYAVPRTEAVSKSTAQWCAQDVLDKANVEALLQGTRAMPACPGDLLGWAFDIVHWGGPVARHASGRRSVSYELIAAEAKPEPADMPAVPLQGDLPSHRERIRAIAAALAEYRKFEPLVLRYRGVAERLLAAVS